MGLSDYYLGYYDKINSYVLGVSHSYRRLIGSDYGSGVSMGLDYTRYDRLDYGQLVLGLELFTRQSLMRLAYYLPSSDAKQFSSASTQLVGMPGYELSMIKDFDRLSLYISYEIYSEDKVAKDVSALSFGGQFLLPIILLFICLTRQTMAYLRQMVAELVFDCQCLRQISTLLV